ncbi:MAG: hypothetical protein FWE40_07150 [Oscillospiraceae bacterium]|nr:hypothetical protein [Oscillospiraceae bacterium]
MNQTPSYVRNAAAHAGGDFVLWLRYISKWVNPVGHDFTPEEVQTILHDEQLTAFQKAIFERAITPGTATNLYAVRLRQPIDVREIERKLLSGELTY